MDTKTILIVLGVVGVGALAYFLFASPGSQSGSVTSGLPDLGSAGFLSGINNFPGQDWITQFETAGQDLVNSGKKLLDSVDNLTGSLQKTVNTVNNGLNDTKAVLDKGADGVNTILTFPKTLVKTVYDYQTGAVNTWNGFVKWASTPPSWLNPLNWGK